MFFDDIKLVLWDVDGTILDFYESQKSAIQRLFLEFDLGICSDEMIDAYDSINKKYWKAMERGEITKKELLPGRFREFFGKYGIDTSLAQDFNERYQVILGDVVSFYPGVMEWLRYFKERGCFQFAVTNGTKIAQIKKLSNSGLDKIFDAIFISEDVGYEKPNPKFFETVLHKAIQLSGNISLSEIVIIGDSLTSDIKLGNNVGIKTCWFRHPGEDENRDYKIDLEIDRFSPEYIFGGGQQWKEMEK